MKNIADKINELWKEHCPTLMSPKGFLQFNCLGLAVFATAAIDAVSFPRPVDHLYLPLYLLGGAVALADVVYGAINLWVSRFLETNGMQNITEPPGEEDQAAPEKE